MSARSWPIVFPTTSYFTLVFAFLSFVTGGTGACATSSAFLFLFVGVQSASLKPWAVSAATLKLSIEQTSATVRSPISGAADDAGASDLPHVRPRALVQ